VFDLKASNGKIILTGEPYQTKIDAVRCIESVKKTAANDSAYVRRTSDNNKYYFILEEANGHVIGESKLYLSITGMEKGIASIKANAPYAKVYDWVLENNKNNCCRLR